MDVVIRDTKTIEEFKTRRADMEQRAMRYYETHRAACEDWRDGEPSRVMFSWDGSFIIEYESGRWWHYRDTDNGIEWY